MKILPISAILLILLVMGVAISLLSGCSGYYACYHQYVSYSSQHPCYASGYGGGYAGGYVLHPREIGMGIADIVGAVERGYGYGYQPQPNIIIRQQAPFIPMPLMREGGVR